METIMIYLVLANAVCGHMVAFNYQHYVERRRINLCRCR